MTEFGLALGGGGVKGLAHIPLLKKIDELGIKPEIISGTSMGAIIGALYAAGLSGLEIEDRVKSHLVSLKDGIKSTYKKRRALVKWVKVFAFEKAKGGLITADGLFEHLFTEILDLEFSDLDIPLSVVATDFHSGKEQRLSEGPLLTAVRASMAVPGVFAPVDIDGQLLVDGGLINNVPCGHVSGNDRIVIASDVISLSTNEQPKTTQVLSGALSIMLRAATEKHFAQTPPDFVLTPNTEDIEAFDFHKIPLVLKRGEEAVERQAKALEQLFNTKS